MPLFLDPRVTGEESPFREPKRSATIRGGFGISYIPASRAPYGEILLFTVLISLVLLPLRVTSRRSALKMQRVQPQIDAIKAKH